MQEIKIPEGCKASIDFDKRVVVIEEDKHKFSKGDIVYSDFFTLIYRGTNENGGILTDIFLINEYQILRLKNIVDCGCGFTRDFRIATPYEQQLFFDALAKEGKKWNANTLQIENIENDILVPESIGIYRYNAPHEYGGGDNLFIGFNDNTQLLGYCADRWVAYPNIYNDNKKVQCKLTPCKREDLKNGDTAFISDTFRLDDSMLSDRGRYVKIIGDKAIKINKKGEPIYDNAFHNHWYKVEPL